MEYVVAKMEDISANGSKPETAHTQQYTHGDQVSVTSWNLTLAH